MWRPITLPPLACAATGAWNYTSPLTNDTYVFNSTTLNQADAQASCKVAGGHLVAWTSVEEQVGAAQRLPRHEAGASRHDPFSDSSAILCH
jgi:hypothetical protein